MNETSPTMQQQQQQQLPQQHHHYHVNHPEAVYFVHSTYQSPELFMSQDSSQSSGGSGDTLKFVSNSPEMDEPLEKPRTGQCDEEVLVNRYHQHQQRMIPSMKMSPPGLVLLNKTANTYLPVASTRRIYPTSQPPPPLMAINDEIIISENRKQPPLLPNPNRMASYVDDCSEYLEFSASSCSASSSLFMPHSSFSQQAGSTKKPSTSIASNNNNTSAYVNKNLSSYIDHGSYFSPMSMSMSDRSNNSSSSCCMSSDSSSSSAHQKRAVNRNLNVTNFGGGGPIADMSSTNAASFLTSDAAAAVEQQPMKNPLLRNPKLSHLKTNNTSTPSNSKFIYTGFAPYMPASLAAPSCDLTDANATQAARDQFLKIDEEDEELRIQMIPGKRYFKIYAS